jgi:hypothetical protein
MEGESEKSFEIDVGGGNAEALIKKASEHPEKVFIMLEPSEVTLPEKPDNLHVIQWRSEPDGGIPLAEESVDEANIDFLMGEIRWHNHPNTDTDEETFAKYKKLLADVRSALKDGGMLHITDVQYCIREIVNLLQEEGFEIVRGPMKVADEAKTPWTKFFADAYKSGGKSEDESEALPMEVDAMKSGQ